MDKLQNVISERNQMQKIIYCFQLYEMSIKDKPIKTESRLVFPETGNGYRD